MRRLIGRGLWRIGGTLAVLVLLIAGHNFAQDPPKTGVVDPKLEAFDGDIVGYEGIVIDMKTVSAAYNELDFQIADWEENIKRLQSLIADRQALGGSAADSKIAEYNLEISDYQAHIQELEARKKLRDAGAGCDEKIKAWQDLYNGLEHNMTIEAGYAASAPSNDVRAYFQDKVELDKALLGDAVGQITVIKEACEAAKDEEALANFKSTVEKANKAVTQAAAEAMAIAVKGHFNDIPAISEKLGIVLRVARVNQLLGNEEIGLAQQQLAIKTLGAFAEEAPKACLNENFDTGAPLAVQRQVEMLGLPGDLHPCLNRLMASGGGQIGPGTYFAYRHCGTSTAGTWQIREFSKFMKVEGDAAVSGGPGVTGTAQVNDDGSGTVTISGTFFPNDRVNYPFKIAMDGTVNFAERTTKAPQGLDTGRYRNMTLHLTTEAHTVTNIFHRTVTVPASTQDEEDSPVVIINNHKPCDPSKSVWDYP